MSVKLSEKKLNLIKTIAKNENFEDYKIDVDKGTSKGDGYLGIIDFVKIQDNKKPDHELNLVLKSAETNDTFREQTPVRKAYDREIFMYETVFPAFLAFSEKFNITNKFTETAKSYGSIFDEYEESLVLENLREKNYKLWNRMLPMNYDHVKIVFETYGKLHGTSLAMKILEREKYDKICANLKNIFEESDASTDRLKKSLEDIINIGFKAVKGNEKATNGLKRFSDTFMGYCKELVENPEPIAVVLHGDCWCNNMMFKYEDKNDPEKPTKVCLLDWQITKHDSPIRDLSYFFLTCASKDLYKDFDKLLHVYHDSVSSILVQANCKPGEVLSYEELKRQWKKHSKFGLFLAIMVIKVMVAQVDEAPNISELASQGKTLMEAIAQTDVSNEELYLERVSDAINFMVDNDYI